MILYKYCVTCDILFKKIQMINKKLKLIRYKNADNYLIIKYIILEVKIKF